MNIDREGRDHARLIDERRTDILARLARLEDRLVAVRAARGDWTDEEHDPEGFALVDEWSRLEGTRSEYYRELRELDRAQARLRDGTFGVCEVCGEPIPHEQLRRSPARTRCVGCTDGRVSVERR